MTIWQNMLKHKYMKRNTNAKRSRFSSLQFLLCLYLSCLCLWQITFLLTFNPRQHKSPSSLSFFFLTLCKIVMPFNANWLQSSSDAKLIWSLISESQSTPCWQNPSLSLSSVHWDHIWKALPIQFWSTHATKSWILIWGAHLKSNLMHLHHQLPHQWILLKKDE